MFVIKLDAIMDDLRDIIDIGGRSARILRNRRDVDVWVLLSSGVVFEGLVCYELIGVGAGDGD